ncbi:MAG: V-type ATPase 116kDa subunit family protein [Candidatus ainarchaeum sp.]|nr:V-type ATPase 116kDa subunit family protein [Candidatus ainarchaeum sp.]
MPSGDCGRVEAALKERFGGDVIMEHKKGGHDQPTMLRNPNALGPFEFMVEFISLPKGYEIDPTLLFALGFPIIYGMMLGDAGYGLVSFIIALLVSRKFKGTMLEPIGKVWALVALPTVIFGFIYNEYFGFKLSHIIGEHACGMIPTLFGFSLCEGMPRMENITLLLLATLFVGMAHLAIGFVLGALNKYREGETWHAAAKIAWIGVEFAGVALVATIMFRALPDWVVAPSALVALAAVAVIIKVEGVLGLIEIPGLASNIFSYARILAVGIASVVVAELINELLLPSPDKGVVAVIILIPVYIGLHLFNVVLGMFESLVQGARLNYVEFFSKFYEGGGSRFNPFRYAKHFTK